MNSQGQMSIHNNPAVQDWLLIPSIKDSSLTSTELRDPVSRVFSFFFFFPCAIVFCGEERTHL